MEAEKPKHHISRTKLAVYGTLAALTGLGIYLIVDSLRAQKTGTMAKISNDTGDITVLRDSGGPVMPGVPTPKAHTTKGALCLCANGLKCNGTAVNCDCCNDAHLTPVKKRIIGPTVWAGEASPSY